MSDDIISVETTEEPFFVPGKGNVNLIDNPYDCKDVTHLFDRVVIINGKEEFVKSVEYQASLILNDGFPKGYKLALISRTLNTQELARGRKFQLPQSLKGRDEDIARFLLHIDRVCKHHGISLSHEDHHGAFVLENYNHKRRDWLWKATEKFKHPIQPKKEKTQP